jgi:hypothetical protein
MAKKGSHQEETMDQLASLVLTAERLASDAQPLIRSAAEKVLRFV